MQCCRVLIRRSKQHFSFWRRPLAVEQPGHQHSCYCASPPWNRCMSFLTPRREGTQYFVAPTQWHSLKHLKLPSRTFLSFGDGDEETGLSKQHQEHRLIGYSPEQLFAVVAAVDLYEDFVPWCQRSTVLEQREDFLKAELEIGFKLFVEHYISHVQLQRPTIIKTSVSQSNLFKYLVNEWEFKAGPTPGSCNLHFLVDFQFRSPLYNQVANMFFNEVVYRLVSSFEERCSIVYGPRREILGKEQVA